MTPGRQSPERPPKPPIQDLVRKRPVADTPEERVRQAILDYLVGTLRVPERLIGVEYSLAALEKGNFHRVDIVVWRPGAGGLTPWLLVECKAPGIPMDEAVAAQAAGYLGKVPCAFVMLSNGRDSLYLERAGDGYRRVAALPFFPGS